MTMIITKKKNWPNGIATKRAILNKFFKGETRSDKILKFLGKFEVIFYHPNLDTMLIPSLFPNEIPFKKKKFIDIVFSLKNDTLYYGRDFKISFNPHGLFSRLLVRFNFLLGSDCRIFQWSDGILIENLENATNKECDASSYVKQICFKSYFNIKISKNKRH
jgi:hypothetical protein